VTEAEDFSFRARKDGTVRIQWRGRDVVTLAGVRAAKFMAQCEGKTGAELQLVMARFTGNFKRGNERRDRS
jgi:hypothetical protein